MTKTFGLVQSNKFKKTGNAQNKKASIYYTKPNATSQDPKQALRTEIADRNDLDRDMGFAPYLEGPEKLGWLVNMHPVHFLELIHASLDDRVPL
jgi:hypothetical protein